MITLKEKKCKTIEFSEKMLRKPNAIFRSLNNRCAGKDTIATRDVETGKFLIVFGLTE